LATLTVVALCAGVSVTAAGASAEPTQALRDRVDAIGNRYFAAKEAARRLDDQLRALDQKLALARRREKALHPVAKATAVQLYQGSAQGFSAWFDVADAMESARRAELIARAGDRTQAFLDEYMNAADRLARQREQVARARDKQARVVADLAKQEATLERLLAQAQQSYVKGLAARAAAAAQQPAATKSAAATGGPTAAPPAPIPVSAPPPPAVGTNPHHNDPFLVCTRTRESAGDYTAVNLAGYYGAYQFSESTWDVTANHAGSPQLIGVRPDQASPWDQDQLAWVLYQWQGNGPWLGLC
jgi:hypothetical protein